MLEACGVVYSPYTILATFKYSMHLTLNSVMLILMEENWNTLLVAKNNSYTSNKLYSLLAQSQNQTQVTLVKWPALSLLSHSY